MPVAHPCGPPGPLHLPGDVLTRELGCSGLRQRSSRRAPRRDRGRRPVGLVAPHVRRIGSEESADFAGDRGEHLRPRDRAGHQRRHPPQRGLLGRQPRRTARLTLRARRQRADDERGDEEGDEYRPVLRRPGIEAAGGSEEEVVERQDARQRHRARGRQAVREADRHDGEQVEHAQADGRHARVEQRDHAGGRSDEQRAREGRAQPARDRQGHARIIPGARALCRVRRP